jgi:hypothetical protein
MAGAGYVEHDADADTGGNELSHRANAHQSRVGDAVLCPDGANAARASG